MQYLPYLKPSSEGGKLRKTWEKDVPLPVAEGGAMEPLTPARYKEFGEHLLNGDKLVGLGCLTYLSMEMCCSFIKLEDTLIEKMARTLFTDGQAEGCTPADLECDDWYDKHAYVFPRAFADKYAISVVVRDHSVYPGKFRILVMTEMVAAFWKTMDRIRRQMASLTAGKAATVDLTVAETGGVSPATGGMSPETGGMSPETQAKLATLTKALADARRLQRNAVFIVEYAATEMKHDDLVLQRREAIEILRDYVGLNGWNYIAAIGSRRDMLVKTGGGSAAQVVKSFTDSGVKWSAGHVLSEPMVTKILTLYDKIKKHRARWRGCNAPSRT